MMPPSPNKECSTPEHPRLTLLTNHGNALLLIAQDGRMRIRDMAAMLEITERATQRIVADLIRAGYVDRDREGRRNVYHVRTHTPIELPIERDVDLGSFLSILLGADHPGTPR